MCVQKDVLGENALQLFKDTIDLGDFISVTGTLFTTDRGERSLLATAWNIASKALLPLPENGTDLLMLKKRTASDILI